MTAEEHRCLRCGNCCRVPGYVRMTPEDVDGAAEFLDLSVEAFTAQYTCVTADRRALSLTEREDHACVFLNPDGTCLIHAVKPQQCRDFPHKWHFIGYERICAAAKGKHEK